MAKNDLDEYGIAKLNVVRWSKKDLDHYLLTDPSLRRYTAVAGLVYFAKKWGIHKEILND